MPETTVLLVDDSAYDQLLVRRAWRTIDPRGQLITAQNGVEALNYVFGLGSFQGRPLPDLILLDLKLATVDGSEVLERIRADTQTRLVPIIILSNSAEPHDRLRAYQLGANSYVRKPVNLAQLTDLIEILVLYWLGWNEGPPRLDELGQVP